ncbi:hypothetical protein THIOSC15_3460007 [uncultured Thiomicrorhabdus sp.]
MIQVSKAFELGVGQNKHPFKTPKSLENNQLQCVIKYINTHRGELTLISLKSGLILLCYGSFQTQITSDILL